MLATMDRSAQRARRPVKPALGERLEVTCRPARPVLYLNRLLDRMTVSWRAGAGCTSDRMCEAERRYRARGLL